MNVPSQTTIGRSWLENFAEEDRSTAQLLLDSVEIASLDDVRAGLTDLMTGYASAQNTIMLPIQALEDIQLYANNINSKHPNSKIGTGGIAKTLSKQQRNKLIAFRDFHPSGRINQLPGSEGAIGTFVREWVKTHSFIDSLALDQDIQYLKTNKYRNLIFVTDYIGSGRQVSDYVKSFLRHPKIRSWRSFKYLNVSVLAYASSQAGLSLVRENIQCHVYRPTYAIEDAPWGTKAREAVIDLCERHKGNKAALGYENSGGLFVSTIASAPNNLPGVLLREQSPQWNSMFGKRAYPATMAQQLISYSPPEDLTQIAIMGQNASKPLNIANYKHLKTAQYVGISGTIASALSTIYSKQLRNSEHLARELHIAAPTAIDIVNFLQVNQYITNMLSLTRSGLDLLSKTKIVGSRPPRRTVASKAKPYYPGHLR